MALITYRPDTPKLAMLPGLEPVDVSQSANLVAASMNDLAFELIDLILRLACDDGNDTTNLVTCVAVSKQWRSAARPLLLRKICVAHESRLNELESLLDCEPDVVRHIQTLLIKKQPSSQYSDSTNWLTEIHSSLAEKLTALRTIEFVSTEGHEMHLNPNMLHHFSGLGTVSTLNFRNCMMDFQLLYKLSSLPSVQNVGLYSHTPFAAYNMQSKISPLRWHSVTMDCGDQFRSMKHILKFISCSPPRSLTLAVREMDTAVVLTYLEDHGSMLEDLALEFRTYSPNFEWSRDLRLMSSMGILADPTELELSSCSNLRSLTIRQLDHIPISLFPLHGLVESISSPYIKTLELEFSDHDSRPLRKLAESKALFNTGVLKGLDLLKLVYSGTYNLEWVTEYLQKKFDHVHARGALQVVAAPFRRT